MRGASTWEGSYAHHDTTNAHGEGAGGDVRRLRGFQLGVETAEDSDGLTWRMGVGKEILDKGVASAKT